MTQKLKKKKHPYFGFILSLCKHLSNYLHTVSMNILISFKAKSGFNFWFTNFIIVLTYLRVVTLTIADLELNSMVLKAYLNLTSDLIWDSDSWYCEPYSFFAVVWLRMKSSPYWSLGSPPSDDKTDSISI